MTFPLKWVNKPVSFWALTGKKLILSHIKSKDADSPAHACSMTSIIVWLTTCKILLVLLVSVA